MGSRRSLFDEASALYLDNLERCFQCRINVNSIFSASDEGTKELFEWTHKVLSNCENICATPAAGILFASLISISHFTKNSMFVHWKEASGLKNINLFGLIIGLSGSDKSGLINVIQSCYKTCELLFPDTYVVDGKRSLIHDITGAGLHKELSNGSKFLLMQEADANLTKLGFYHQGQAVGVSTRSLLCEAFDGFTESSKTTGMYDFSIKDSRLSLLGATTGGCLHLLLAHYSVYKISDGCDNRFLYYFIENDLIPYDLIKKSDPLLPSLQQIFVIIHLIGRVIYTFIDSTGNDEAQRYYVTKGRIYIEEGRKLFQQRKQPHLQSFYSKSAEIFPRLCVNMQRLLDAMYILLEMRKGGDLEFAQSVNETFVTKAQKYIQRDLHCTTNSNGDSIGYVTLETCQLTGNLYDNYLFKTIMTLFNLEYSSNQQSMPSNDFRSLLAEKMSVEKRLLQLPFQFFLRSDLKQPSIDGNGKKRNAPFHHVNGDDLNKILNKLVQQKLLCVGNFISRPRAQSTYSYMKTPIPKDENERKDFMHNLKRYNINMNEYNALLARSALPSNCILLSDAMNLLTSSSQHREDCIKYGLLSKSKVNSDGDESSDTVRLSNRICEDSTNNGAICAHAHALTTTLSSSHDTSETSGILDSLTTELNRKDVVESEYLENDVPDVIDNLDNTSEVLISIDRNHIESSRMLETTDEAINIESNDLNCTDHDINYNSKSLLNLSGSEQSATISSDKSTMIINNCVKAILQHPSIILSSSDVTLATRRISSITRRQVIRMMLQKGLLIEDNYFIRQLAQRTKFVKGFAKKLPQAGDETARYDFITVLNSFGISWNAFKSFFDVTEEGFRTSTKLQLSEVAEALLNSDEYKLHVKYDQRAVFRVTQTNVVHNDELEYGVNTTGIEPFESFIKTNAKRKSSGNLRRSKRKRH